MLPALVFAAALAAYRLCLGLEAASALMVPLSSR